jgi:ATP-dependent Clp protease ATP-binding subunit ClpB
MLCCGWHPAPVQGLLREVRMAAGRVILFIDELHLLMDAGRVEGGLNAGQASSGHASCCSRGCAAMLWKTTSSAAVLLVVVQVLGSSAWPLLPPAANLLKPALARGELHCIGATTVEEYRKHIETDGAFARRFQARGPALVTVD